MQTALLLLNGTPPATLPNFASYALRVCTDGAYNYLQKMKCIPDYIIGDLDSLPNTQNIPACIKIIATPDQNKTDFQKALEFLIKKGYEKVDIYGSGGKEQDHFLGNIAVAVRFYKTLHLTFFDAYGYYFFLPPHFEIGKVRGKTISLFPVPLAENISTYGLQYPLRNENLSITERIGTRNKAIEDTIQIEFSKGHLLLFINN